MSLRLRKKSIANLSSIKAGHLPPDTDPDTGPKQCPTTVDPRTDFASNEC
ncbi:hypothetical protein [Kordia periserrulae]|nr:hypothetical protein [Kordia periserrulae]